VDKPNGQHFDDGISPSRARGLETREALYRAAAELIGELGWGSVTTRAVAERAGVPHGAVGYHFEGREALLREAAVRALEELLALPVTLASNVASLTDLMRGTLEWYASGGLQQGTVALLMEALRQADRDDRLREPLARMLGDYRVALTGLIERDQARGAMREDVNAEGLAMVISATIDGLVAHARLDPDLDLPAAGWVILGLLNKP
jgi:AcrR family transcriptional regulator